MKISKGNEGWFVESKFLKKIERGLSKSISLAKWHLF